MPGWFGRHYANMRRYAHMACGGALVGTTSPGRIKATRYGPQIAYTPSPEDLRTRRRGARADGRIFFAAGAQRVMPATFAYHEFTSEGSLDGLSSYVRDNADLLLTSAHPQGGNPVGDPREGGVVDADFRVHGFGNLYVCDASVFPSSVRGQPAADGHGDRPVRGDADPARLMRRRDRRRRRRSARRSRGGWRAPAGP